MEVPIDETTLTLPSALLAAGALALPAGATGDDDGKTTKQRGEFMTLPAGAAMGLEIDGVATIKRSQSGTVVTARVRGLQPGTTYGAHLHNAPCSAPDPGGGHYKHDPAGPSVPPNELWLSSTSDPMAGITANRRGVARGRGEADWVARPEAQSVVIHSIPPGGTPAGGPKIACADLRDTAGGDTDTDSD
jgi:Cu/Zn superoxide dismutase